MLNFSLVIVRFFNLVLRRGGCVVYAAILVSTSVSYWLINVMPAASDNMATDGNSPRVVMTEAACRDWLGLMQFSPYWTPSPNQIEDLEKRLPVFLIKHVSPHHNNITNRLQTYGRQYVSITRNGIKLIFVNAFCAGHGINSDQAAKIIIRVKDGGDCFFELKFDPKSGDFADFFVHGEA